MTKVIGVRFRQAGRIYNFAVGDIEVENGQHVIVETARGIEYGEVVGKIKKINEEEAVEIREKRNLLREKRREKRHQ